MAEPKLDVAFLASLPPDAFAKLPKESQAAVRDWLDLVDAQENLLSFARRMNPEFETPAHIRLIAEKCEEVVRSKKPRRVIITCPPQHGKSWLCSQMLPAFVAGAVKKSRIVLISYGEELATRNARAVRAMVEHENYPFPIQVCDDERRADRFRLTNDSTVLAKGLSSGLLGHTSSLEIIDDLTVSREAADSESQRQSVWDFWTTVARTRLSPSGSVLVIQSRLHGDDFVGRLLAAPDAAEWEVIALPAICDSADDPLKRPLGAALWPARYDAANLEATRIAQGERDWSSMYMGSPVSAGGNVIKNSWVEDNTYAKLPPRVGDDFRQIFGDSGARPPKRRVVIGVDCAASSGAVGDLSAFVVVMFDGVGTYFICDVVTGRLDVINLVQTAIDLNAKWKPRCLSIERASNGLPLLDILKHRTAIPLVGQVPRGSKYARAEELAVLFEGGRIKVPAFPVPWLSDLKSELTSFPNFKTDDRLDALYWAIAVLRQFNRGDRMQLPGNWMAR